MHLSSVVFIFGSLFPFSGQTEKLVWETCPKPEDGVEVSVIYCSHKTEDNMQTIYDY